MLVSWNGKHEDIEKIVTSSSFHFKQISLSGSAKNRLQGARVTAGDQVLNYCSLINIEHPRKTCLQQWPAIKRHFLVGHPELLGLLLTKL